MVIMEKVNFESPSHEFQAWAISVTDKLLNSGWDISVTTIKSIEGNLLDRSHDVRDYNAEEQQAAIRKASQPLCDRNRRRCL
jgi:hypothetical protein